MTNIRLVDRPKAAVMALLIAMSLVASALPASAGYKYDGLDFLDPNNITWEQSLKVRLPGGGGLGSLSITWE